MFLHKYVSDFYYSLIVDNYDTQYLQIMDESNFVNIYNLFQKYNFYYIEDIILKYIEIFELDIEEVTIGLNKLKEKLGDNFVDKIGKNLTYLEEVLDVENFI